MVLGFVIMLGFAVVLGFAMMLTTCSLIFDAVVISFDCSLGLTFSLLMLPIALMVFGCLCM
jgi:hypothetical protein